MRPSTWVLAAICLAMVEAKAADEWKGYTSKLLEEHAADHPPVAVRDIAAMPRPYIKRIPKRRATWPKAKAIRLPPQ